MSVVAFYHLTKFNLAQALPKLLEKTLKLEKRCIVKTVNEQQAEQLADGLWTYDAHSWLPHGTKKDGFSERQPIWITSEDDNPNEAEFLFLTHSAQQDDITAYERCFVVFDGREQHAVDQARKLWVQYKNADHELTYWQQTDQGGWTKKNETKKG